MDSTARDRGRAFPPDRIARIALRLMCLAIVTACTRGEAASVPAMRGGDVPAIPAVDVSARPSFEAPPGTYDAVMAQRGEVLFSRHCAECHVRTSRAPRTTATRYVTLRNLGRDTAYFADGSAKTLDAVVEHYDESLQLHLSTAQQRDLVEHLKSR